MTYTQHEIKNKVYEGENILEKSLLGYALISPNEFYSWAEVDAKDFTTTICRDTYAVIQEFNSQAKPCDLAIVEDRLNSKYGNNFTYQFLQHSSRVVNLKEDIEELKKREKARKVGEVFKKALGLLETKGLTISEIDTNLSKVSTLIDSYYTGNTIQEAVKVSSSFENWFSELETVQSGIDTGFDQFDKINATFGDGQIITICGRPKKGKTQLGVQFFEYISRKHNSLFFSLEMSTFEVQERLLSLYAEVNSNQIDKLRKNEINDPTEAKRIANNLASAIQSYQNHKGLIYDKNCNIWDIQRIARMQKALNKIEILFIDQLSRIKTDGNFVRGSKTEEYSFIMNTLKDLAVELKIPIVLLHQLSRGLEKRDDKTPVMSDIKDSGAVEEISDKMILISGDFDDQPATNWKLISRRSANGFGNLSYNTRIGCFNLGIDYKTINQLTN